MTTIKIALVVLSIALCVLIAACVWYFYEKPLTPEEVEEVLRRQPKTLPEFCGHVKRADCFGAKRVGDPARYARAITSDARDPKNRFRGDVGSLEPFVVWYEGPSLPTTKESRIAAVRHFAVITCHTPAQFWASDDVPCQYWLLLSSDGVPLGWLNWGEARRTLEK